jgi:hypothetical protein
MTDRPLIDEVREALGRHGRVDTDYPKGSWCLCGVEWPCPGLDRARLDGMTIVPAGEVERLDEERLARALHNLAAREAVGIVVENEITDSGVSFRTRACTPADHRDYAAAIAKAYAAPGEEAEA